MQFSFMVGVQEQHQVDFSFDQFIGNLEIRVDGQPLIKDFRMLSLKLTKRYEFTVGKQEQHQIAIEKKRKLFLAGLRPQQYSIFIDGQLVQTYEGQ
jgi:FAIM1 (Fas apoptotic inhibitory molecule) protein